MVRMRIMKRVKLLERVRKSNRRKLKLNHYKIKRAIKKEELKTNKDKKLKKQNQVSNKAQNKKIRNKSN